DGSTARLPDTQGDTQPAPSAPIGAGADLELATVPGAMFAELPLTALRPNPRQPRQVFDEDALGELAHSIREFGVLQPVVVRALPSEAAEAEQDEPCWE